MQLGQVEEQRIKAFRDMENMRVGGVYIPLSLLLSFHPSLLSISPSIHTSPVFPPLALLPQAALVETDSRSDDLEKKNRLLEGEVAYLRQNLKEQSQADEQIMALMNAKTKEWQVDVTFPLPDFLPSFLPSSHTPFLLSSPGSCKNIYLWFSL